MPPGITSRHLFCQGLTDGEGRQYLTERAAFRYKKADDNRVHTVVEGDTLFTLAHIYFDPLRRPSQYYWVIADFQPDEPIVDPTLRLIPGHMLVIPSIRMLVEEIFNESRRDEFMA